ncbi:MAG: hypothetical protein H6515_13120 [Microthrixaceae bacterium]|nr:hypothetical protein [Microthrixaceae bacterium]
MDDRERLEQLRDRLDDALADAKPGDMPALARQYRETIADLRALPDPTDTDEVDELEQRRLATQAKVQKRPGGGGKRSATGG